MSEGIEYMFMYTYCIQPIPILHAMHNTYQIFITSTPVYGNTTIGIECSVIYTHAEVSTIRVFLSSHYKITSI